MRNIWSYTAERSTRTLRCRKLLLAGQEHGEQPDGRQEGAEVEDEADRRRAFIAQTDKAADGMARYFAELGTSAARLL